MLLDSFVLAFALMVYNFLNSLLFWFFCVISCVNPRNFEAGEILQDAYAKIAEGYWRDFKNNE